MERVAITLFIFFIALHDVVSVEFYLMDEQNATATTLKHENDFNKTLMLHCMRLGYAYFV